MSVIGKRGKREPDFRDIAVEKFLMPIREEIIKVRKDPDKNWDQAIESINQATENALKSAAIAIGFPNIQLLEIDGLIKSKQPSKPDDSYRAPKVALGQYAQALNTSNIIEQVKSELKVVWNVQKEHEKFSAQIDEQYVQFPQINGSDGVDVKLPSILDDAASSNSENSSGNNTDSFVRVDEDFGFLSIYPNEEYIGDSKYPSEPK